MILNNFVAIKLLPELFWVLYQIFDFISNYMGIIMSFLRNVSVKNVPIDTPGRCQHNNTKLR